MGDLIEYYKRIPNIDRASSSIIENTISIFLPFKRLDLTTVNTIFKNNDNKLVIDNHLFESVEIRNRLLGQHHKDILEVLMTQKKIFEEDTMEFRIETTSYKILDLMNKSAGNKKWLLEKIIELKDCNINIIYKNSSGENVNFSFAFISSYKIVDENKITIYFTKEYTYFLLKHKLLDYSNYIPLILELDKKMQNIRSQLKLKKPINSNFIKSMVRYVITNNGKNSQISIDNFINKLKLDKLMTEEELKDCVTDLKREEVIKILKNDFGIYLTNNNKTITYNNSQSTFII